MSEGSTAFNETVKLALVGDSGSGKTHQVRHIIEAFGADNVGIVSCEKGLGTIQTLLTPDNVFVADSIEEMREAWGWASKRYNRPDAFVVIDGGSRVMQWISNREHGGADQMLEYVYSGKPIPDMPAAIRPFLRYLTEKKVIDIMKVWIRGGRDAEIFWAAWLKLDCNLYASFWREKTSAGQYDKSLPYTVDTPGNGMRNAIYSAFDYVFHIERVGTGATVFTGLADPVHKCKQRVDPALGINIPDEIPDFNLAKFYQALKPTKENVSV